MNGNSITELFNLEGKIAIVTGAAGQLGGEYVKTLLGAGCSVAAVDINFNNPKSILNGVQSPKLLKVEMDITKRNSIETGLNEIVVKLGDPNILINNAAIDAPPNASEQETGPFETYPESSWQAMVDVNLTGTLLCCQVLGGHMASTGGGSIINVSSIYGILSPDQRIYKYKEELTGKPFVKPVSYSATKAAVLNLTRYLAVYWATKNVRVNSLILGGVFNNQDEIFLKNYNNKVPMGRMANPNEYNGAVLFLASDASSYMTGADLVLDGGFSSW